MFPNVMILLASGLISLVVGSLWYGNFMFGKTWMKVADMTEDKIKGGNMALIFGLTYLLSVILGTGVFILVVHQADLASIFMNEEGFIEKTGPAYELYQSIMDQYGHTFRTFKHGVFHGVLASIILVLPIVGINALFERRGGKYIFIHVGYWAVTLGLMGGVLCQWA